MCPSFPRTLVLVLALALVLLTSGPLPADTQAWKSFVHKDLHRCCSMNTDAGHCLSIDAAVLRKDGSLVLFWGEFFIVATSVRPNNYPVLATDSVNVIKNRWGDLNTVSRSYPVNYALLVGDLTVLRHKTRYYSFKQQVQQGPITSDPKRDFKGGLADNNLVSTATFQAPKGKEPWIVLYVNNGGLKYHWLAFPGNVAKPALQGAPSQGYPVSITSLKRDDANQQEVVVEFNFWRVACMTRRKYGDELFSFSNTHMNWRHPECWPQNMFLGCPQSFCYRNDVDDIYKGPTGEAVTLYRGPYAWVLSDSALPMKTPDMNHAQVLGSHGMKNHLPYIDAADIVFDENTKEKFVFLFKDSKVLVISTKKGGTEAVQPLTDIDRVFPGIGASSLLDASLYNQRLKKMFLFKGTNFWIFTPTFSAGSITWAADGGKRFIGNEMRGVCESIDGALSKGDNIYVFKEQWFYSLKEETWSNAKGGNPYVPKIMFGDDIEPGFFTTKKDCKFWVQVGEMKKRLLPLIPPAAGKDGSKPPPPPPPPPGKTAPPGETLPTGNPLPGQSTDGSGGGKDKGSTFPWWILIVLLLVLVVVGAGIFAFLAMSKKKRVQEPPPSPSGKGAKAGSSTGGRSMSSAGGSGISDMTDKRSVYQPSKGPGSRIGKR